MLAGEAVKVAGPMSQIELFSDDARRNPFPLYAQLRATSPVFREPRSRLWMVLDYESVQRVLSDHESFSSRHGPETWMIFQDPPRHAKLRALVSKAFTPRSIAAMEGRIAEVSRELLDAVIDRGEMDLAADYTVPLPMRVIGEMLGVPREDRPLFLRWNDVLLRMSYAVVGSPDTAAVLAEFAATNAEMAEYVAARLAERAANPTDDLLTRLARSEVDGERLTNQDILGFFQLLLLAGSETTTNLINNAILCFIENRQQLPLVRADIARLLPGAVEEVLRYRSPLQWMYRLPRRDVELRGQTIRAGEMVLAVIGSANHDPAVFADPARFDAARDPNTHLTFGQGAHFCLGAALARLEARIALTDLLTRLDDIRLASDQPWEPRKGLHVHGPVRLPIRFRRGS